MPRKSHHPIRKGPKPPARKHRASVPKSHAPAAPIVIPPTARRVWHWAGIGAIDGLIFLAGAVISSIIQVRTGFQWLFLVGIVIAIILTNIRKLPQRPKPLKAGYFGGLTGLFAVGTLAMMLTVMRALWRPILALTGVLGAVALIGLYIGLRSATPEPGDGADDAR